jgi:hypothetical protein
MKQLSRCPHCESFNPMTVGHCLNCNHDLTNTVIEESSLAKRLLKGVGVVAISMTLTACYGQIDVPCETVDADGAGVCAENDCDDQNMDVSYSCDEMDPMDPEVEGESEVTP